MNIDENMGTFRFKVAFITKFKLSPWNKLDPEFKICIIKQIGYFVFVKLLLCGSNIMEREKGGKGRGEGGKQNKEDKLDTLMRFFKRPTPRLE
jgi:hypothetical protein